MQKKVVFFLSVAVTTFGFAPMSSFAHNGNVVAGPTISTSGGVKEIKPLHLDKAVENSKVRIFFTVWLGIIRILPMSRILLILRIDQVIKFEGLNGDTSFGPFVVLDKITTS
jgi:hypothetical protein